MAASRSSAVGQGLAEVRTAVGTLIAYATGPGDVASDGDGPHSPFTSALLDHIATPGLEVRQVLGRVRNAVLAQTRERQVPWDSSSLLGEFYFKMALPSPAPVATTPNSSSNVQPEYATDSFDERQLDLRFWEYVSVGNKAADFEAYLRGFPNGVFADLARSKLDDLRQTSGASGNAAPSTSPPAESIGVGTELTSVSPPKPAQVVAAEPPLTPTTPALPDVAPQANDARGQSAEPVIAALPVRPIAAPGPTPAEIEATLALSRETWREVQRGLTALGFSTRGTDGIPGINTRRALANWQKLSLTDPTGYLNTKQNQIILEKARPILLAPREPISANLTIGRKLNVNNAQGRLIGYIKYTDKDGSEIKSTHSGRIFLRDILLKRICCYHNRVPAI